MWTITNTEVRDGGWEMGGWDQRKGSEIRRENAWKGEKLEESDLGLEGV